MSALDPETGLRASWGVYGDFATMSLRLPADAAGNAAATLQVERNHPAVRAFLDAVRQGKPWDARWLRRLLAIAARLNLTIAGPDRVRVLLVGSALRYLPATIAAVVRVWILEQVKRIRCGEIYRGDRQLEVWEDAMPTTIRSSRSCRDRRAPSARSARAYRRLLPKRRRERRHQPGPAASSPAARSP
jgi:hypothetical protein